MELECVKYKEKMSAEGAFCRHPNDYCKHRTSCIIHFISGEQKQNNKSSQIESQAKEDGSIRVVKMIKLAFHKSVDGLLPAVVQDYVTGEVLMVAYCNQEAWELTLNTGKAHFWSRSRKKNWLKGESSGHVQLIKEIRIDCDRDTILFRVEQLGGAACHKGYRSCFFHRVDGDELVIDAEQVFDPADVYK